LPNYEQVESIEVDGVDGQRSPADEMIVSITSATDDNSRVPISLAEVSETLFLRNIVTSYVDTEK